MTTFLSLAKDYLFSTQSLKHGNESLRSVTAAQSLRSKALDIRMECVALQRKQSPVPDVSRGGECACTLRSWETPVVT